jgi:hypothetical protein
VVVLEHDDKATPEDGPAPAPSSSPSNITTSSIAEVFDKALAKEFAQDIKDAEKDKGKLHNETIANDEVRLAWQGHETAASATLAQWHSRTANPERHQLPLIALSGTRQRSIRRQLWWYGGSCGGTGSGQCARQAALMQ